MVRDDMNRVRVWASWEEGFPRLVAEMSREDWLAGKEIPRVPPLAWGEAWTQSADPVAGVLLRIIDGDVAGFNEAGYILGRITAPTPLYQIISCGPGAQARIAGGGLREYLLRWTPGEFPATATLSVERIG